MLSTKRRRTSVEGRQGEQTYQLVVQPPERAIDVLEAEIELSYDWDVDVDQVGLVDARPLAEWCAHHILKVDGDCVATDDAADFLLSRVADAQILALKGELVETAHLDEDVHAELIDYYEVVFSGGCECSFCDGRADERRAHCNYSQFDSFTIHIAGLFAGCQDEDLLERPFALYQIRGCQQVAQWRVREDEKEQTDRREEIHERMEQAGIPKMSNLR